MGRERRDPYRRLHRAGGDRDRQRRVARRARTSSPTSRRRCGGSRRWWHEGLRPKISSRPPPRRSAACYPSEAPRWVASNRTTGYHGGLVEHHRGCLSHRQAVADRGQERRVDGAPDGPVRSYRRLLGCHRPDRRRRTGGGLQVGGWKPDRRRRPSLGRHDGDLDRRPHCRRAPRRASLRSRSWSQPRSPTPSLRRHERCSSKSRRR